MHSCHILERHEAGPVLANALDVEKAFLLELIARVEQALLPLRMGGRNGPVKGGKEDHAKGIPCSGKGLHDLCPCVPGRNYSSPSIFSKISWP